MVLQKIKEGDKDLLRKIEDYRQTFITKSIKWFPYLNWDQLSDAYSEAILILYANVQSGKLTKLTTSVEGYLFAIGRNTLRNESRKMGKFFPLKIDLPDDDTSESEKQLEEEEILQKCLAKMGNRAQQMFSLLIFEGKSIAEVAKVMQFSNTLSASTAKHKFMTKLKKLYNQEKLHYHHAG